MKPNWTMIALVGMLLASAVLCLYLGHEGAATGLFAGAVGLAIPRGVVHLIPVALVVALGASMSACGGSTAEQRPTLCAVTEMACNACETARQTYCGGEAVETEQ